MDDPTVYTDPGTPGAPQYGDLVVVARDSWGISWSPAHPLTPDREDLEGVPCMVEGTSDRTRKLFGGLYYVQTAQDHLTWGLRPEGWVRAVRRPTEAELATWVLSQTGGAP